MTRFDGKELTDKGAAIVSAIISGCEAMTATRWAEEAAKAAEFEDEGEWFAPEFAAARAATEGISWDFDGWQNACDAIMVGAGKLGGVSLIA